MKVALLIGTLLLSAANVANAFGNNRFGCTDWPEWTPMYWMQEMLGEDCDDVYGASYLPPYAGMQGYQSPYMSNYSRMPATPYGSPYQQANPYFSQQQAFMNARNPYQQSRSFNPYQNQFPMWGNQGRSSNFRGNNSFPMMGNNFGSPMGNNMNPMGGMSPMGMGMNPMGGMSPMGMGMNPMSGGMNPMGGMSPMGMGMNPMSGGMNPMGGMSPMGMGMNPMGSPFSGANPMSTGSPFGGGFGTPYGSPTSGMSPFSRSPFGSSSSMNPFSGGMMRSF